MTDSSPDTLDLGRARLLLRLAELAQGDLSDDVFLPDGWDILKVFRADGGTAPRAAGFYARGRPAGPGTPRVAVLALALPWHEYVDSALNRAGPTLAALPPGVAPADSDARFETSLGAAYAQLRAPLWDNLGLALSPAESDGTLWITGMNLAGPLAQLAAVDLRPGNRGPRGEAPPAAAPACWTFSSPPAGNPAFKAFAETTGTAFSHVWAGTAAEPADFFPTTPGDAQGFALPGAPVRLEVGRATPDDPWTERGGPFYLRALRGRPDGIAVPGAVVDPPAAFSREMARTLALLTLSAYEQRQHPNAPDKLVVPGFTYTGGISCGGVPWCALFQSAGVAVAAFRGTVTFDELARVTANSEVGRADFLGARLARVHAGVLGLYTAPTASAGGETFRAALVRLLGPLAAGRDLYLTGHDVGGALASLAALDLRVNTPALSVKQVYTFGDTPLGNYDFSVAYAERLGADTCRLVRDGDFVRGLQMRSAYVELPGELLVTGAPADDDMSRHSLASYSTLLQTPR